MEPNKKEKKDNPSTELEFEVMPFEDSDEISRSATSEVSGSKDAVSQKGFSNHKTRVWVISILAILALFIIGFLGYRYFFKDKIKDLSSPKIVVPAVDDMNQDTDADGLSDERERELGSDPNDSDTDKDGLSDGDEVNIYKSDPLLEDTDLDTFLDGDEVARGFSPIVNTLERASEEEKQGWSDAIVEYGLHEPTKSTISESLEKDTENKPESSYFNSTFQYQVDLPSALEVRESSDSSTVGFYVKGTTPDDDNPGNDIITISIAIKPAEKTLSEWGETFLVEGENYRTKETIEQTEFSAVKYFDLINTEDQCPLNQVHFSKPNDSKVFAVTLSCNESDEFIELFDQIVSSFDFTK